MRKNSLVAPHWFVLTSPRSCLFTSHSPHAALQECSAEIFDHFAWFQHCIEGLIPLLTCLGVLVYHDIISRWYGPCQAWSFKEQSFIVYGKSLFIQFSLNNLWWPDSPRHEKPSRKIRKGKIALFDKTYKLCMMGANIYVVVEINGKCFIYNSRPWYRMVAIRSNICMQAFNSYIKRLLPVRTRNITLFQNEIRLMISAKEGIKP